MKIHFYGAAREVTGSCHLIELDDGYRILLDCGLYQGRSDHMESFNRSFYFKPSNIDCVILSHAHIDHSGRLPLLVRNGYTGPIHCTHATRSLCSIMLADSAMIQERDAKYENKRRRKKNKSKKKPAKPLYNLHDVNLTMNHMIGHGYDKWFKINKRVKVQFRDAGHILGSASINLRLKDGNKRVTLGFTGDIGRPNRPILRDPQLMDPVDYMITESTYGDRLHEGAPDELDRFLDIIKKSCLEKRGKLIIPAFSVGRTQEIVYMLDRLEGAGKLPRIPVYVDSPLAVNATKIFGIHPECYDKELNAYILRDPNPFGFNQLTYVTSTAVSKSLNNLDRACIIISSAGMMNAGRVKHHLFHNIDDPKATFLMVGYCAPYTPGGILRSGADKIRVFGEWKPVRADVQIMDSFSAHGDQLEMMDFLKNQVDSVKKLFLVHGEYLPQQRFSEKLSKIGFNNIEIPHLASRYKLDVNKD